MVERKLKYKHLIVYYFSGTGNSKKCAEWITEKGRGYHIDTHLVNIDKFEEIEIPDLDGKTLIGFCSPTHGFNLPPIMLKFISGFPKVDNADVFILNTRAGMKLHKIFLPGLSGIAQYLPALMLKNKGFKIVGMQPVDLPSNWILFHPGLSEKVVASLFKKHKRIVEEFTTILLNGEKKYQAFWSLPIDLFLAPIALGYYFVGRFFLAKTLFATSKCDACMLCVKNCPVEAIKWLNEKPYWTWKCESCMRCVNLCPERVIQTAHSFTAFIIYISSLLFSFVLAKLISLQNLSFLSTSSFFSKIVLNILLSVIMLILVFSGYRFMHYLMRFKIFDRIIEYTSLSRFKWWRRYKANKVLKNPNLR